MAYFGVCYSPFRVGSPSDWKNKVTEATVETDMDVIRGRGFTHIRTYDVAGGNQWTVDKAVGHNLGLGLGVWITPNNPDGNNAQVKLALEQVEAARNKYGKGAITLDLVIGNEVDRTGNHIYKPQDVKGAMDYAKAVRKNYSFINARVTSCFSGTVLQHTGSSIWTNIVKNDCEGVVYLTVYPWYGQGDGHDNRGQPMNPNDIDPQMQWSYYDGGIKNVVQWAFKEVVIAEIGWPSAGKPSWATTPDNEKANYATTQRWLATHSWNKGNTPFDCFWFSMFDEPWKTNEGSQGPYWGLYDKDAKPKWPW
jgi:exo-beta-1,3-glucanase (GH17 family)